MTNNYKLSETYDISRKLIEYIFLPEGKIHNWAESELKPELTKLSLQRIPDNPLQIQNIEEINLDGPIKDPDYGKLSFNIETVGYDDGSEPDELALIVFVVEAKTGKIYAVDIDTDIYK